MMTRHERNALSSIQARRELYGATDEENAARLLRFWRRCVGSGNIQAVQPHHIAAVLPSLVNDEVEEARAAAMAIIPRTPETEKEWLRLLQKMQCLESWAVHCAYASTQQAAVEELRRHSLLRK